MSETYPSTSGPDRLDNLASQAEAEGLHINAETFAQLARDWRQDLADLERANQRINEQTRALDKARAGLSVSVEALQKAA